VGSSPSNELERYLGHIFLEKERKVNFAVFLGYFTGLRFLANDLPFPTLLGTALIVHLLDGVMCRLFAYNNGYPKNLWTIFGLFFGIWAIAILVLLPKREKP
jgi:hypothetical protein